nr:MAG TPA: hypothetical protein [Caudoviricetes sp.]DAU61389.1 MAG TPA: hypothetical protein [Caudoviricetes sp.]
MYYILMCLKSQEKFLKFTFFSFKVIIQYRRGGLNIELGKEVYYHGKKPTCSSKRW